MGQLVGETILKYLDDNGIKHVFLSKKTGIRPQTLSAKLNGKYNFSLHELGIICNALGKTPNDFIMQNVLEESKV